LKVNLESLLGPHLGLCWRVVETQEVAATRAITKSADDQRRLEELLDLSKPNIPPDCEGLSYLLMTPFRYPPLKYGSRFGSTMERGIFYGAADLRTAFAETAVYFWLFQSGPIVKGPLETIRDQRTAFSARLSSQKALDLGGLSSIVDLNEVCNPASWSYSQTIGSKLRTIGAEFFWYPSARITGGKNIAVLSPKAFASREPEKQLHWNVRFNSSTCWFGCHGSDSFEYRRSSFECDGLIPHPAL